MQKLDINKAAVELQGRPPAETLRLALDSFTDIAVSFSGAEDVVLVDICYRLLQRKVPVFSLDTGRLHAETYRFLERCARAL